MGTRWKLLIMESVVVLFLVACSFGKEKAEINFGNNIGGAKEDTLTAVSLKEDDTPEGLASSVYNLEVDASYTEPVTITVPVEVPQDLEDTEAVPMLGVGRDILMSDGSSETLYQYVEATLTEDKVTATFIPAEYAESVSVNGSSKSGTSTGTPSKERLRLGIFWCSTTFEQGGHFIVYFPAQAHKVYIPYDQREILLNDLEAVYNKYLSIGYAYESRSDWPMEVTIQNLDAEGYYSYGLRGANGKISLNKSLFDGGYQSSRVKPLLAHEFFHFVQMNYEGVLSGNLWFDEATATYFESVETGSLPSIVNEYKEKIFAGVYPSENTAANGYARMPLIAHLAGRAGEGFILNTYKMVLGGTEWDDALLSAAGPPASWAGDFYDALVTGKVGDYAPYTFYSNLSKGSYQELGTALALQIPPEEDIREMQENGEIPILGETTLSIDAYGAKMAALTITPEELKKLPDAMNPAVSIDGSAQLAVYAVKGRTATKLETAGGEVELKDFKKASGQKMAYLVVVTGLHDSGKADYKVSVKVPLYPTLDELVGTYEDGSLTFTDVYISDAAKAKAAESDSEESSEGEDDFGMYCDLDILGAIEAMEGQTAPYYIMIGKTGENTGTLTLAEAEEGAAAEVDEENAIPFTYTNGVLAFDYNKEGANIGGNMKAAYGKNKDVMINGRMIISMGEDIKITIDMKGSKPLEPKAE